MTEPEIEPGAEAPAEAEPADVLEQRVPVEGDEEAERPVTPPSGTDVFDTPEEA